MLTVYCYCSARRERLANSCIIQIFALIWLGRGHDCLLTRGGIPLERELRDQVILFSWKVLQFGNMGKYRSEIFLIRSSALGHFMAIASVKLIANQGFYVPSRCGKYVCQRASKKLFGSIKIFHLLSPSCGCEEKLVSDLRS